MEENHVDENVQSGADEQRLAAAQNKKNQEKRNVANNANNARAAYDIASKSSNPWAKAIGTAGKLIDKDGKLGGKILNSAIKTAPGGRITQAASNLMSESGTADRIGKAVSKKNQSNVPLSVTGSAKAKGKSNENTLEKKEVEEHSSDGGGISFDLTVKIIKVSMIAMIPIIIVVVFVNLFTASALAVRNLIGIGNADSTSDADMNKKIEEGKQDDLENKDKSNEDAFDYDLFISEEGLYFRNSKLKQINNEYETKSRLYNEADIRELNDYYSDIARYEENYDMDLVYTFFFKLHYLYFHYEKNYKVSLDLPLLMSTLMLKSNDMNNVFISNTIGYYEPNLNSEDCENEGSSSQVCMGSDNERFKYDKQISYTSSETSAEYDMEILSQHMVSKVPYVAEEKTCEEKDVVDGSWCYLIDYDRYNEFLKEYLEKKYLTGGILTSSFNKVVKNDNTCTSNSFIKYDLTDDQVTQIASLAYHEQGTPKGAAAEASLMANLFEIKGSKFGDGALGLYNYIRNSGWFANSAKFMDSRDASSEIIAAVKSVLVDGKRTLPGYIDEHDYILDLSSVTNDGIEISKNDRTSYIKFKTKLKNKYGSIYTFYSFPDSNSDPFGYTSEKIRTDIGDFYYDFDTGEPMNCSSSKNNEYANALITLANKEVSENSGKDGTKYNQYFGYSQNTPWCANFVSYLISNTSVNGIFIYPNIIDFRSAGAGTFIRNFNNSIRDNIKFYYNDNCSKLSGKNGSDKVYVPKVGDFIFFDWEAKYTDISSNTQDHVGIVEKYQDGIIYTIEGNSGVPGRAKKNKYNISSCKVIGFGSWY